MRTIDLECQFLGSNMPLPIGTAFCLFCNQCNQVGIVFLPIASELIVCMEKLSADKFVMRGALRFARNAKGHWTITQMVIDPSVKSKALVFRIANLLLDKVVERREANRATFGDSAIIFKMLNPQSCVAEWLADMHSNKIVVDGMVEGSYVYHGYQTASYVVLIRERQVFC